MSSGEVLRIVAVGHVDHGKSTVIGRLLYDTNSITEGVINKVKKVCEEDGKVFEYAFLLDAFEEEQKQGITIDTTEIKFKSEKRDYVIIDAPGHKEFLKNMISGAASAEGALLIIDSNEGIQEQSKRHGYILSLLGIKQVYVLVNKMDLINYDEDKFNNIKLEMNKFLENLGVYPKKYIPISAYYGENLSRKSNKMNWYNGETVLEALDLFTKERGLEDKELRLPIQDVYKFDDRRIIAGRIESGKIAAGDEVLISPSNKITRVKSIEYFLDEDKRRIEETGRSIGIILEDEFYNKRGEIISHTTSKPLTGDTIEANIIWMGKNNLDKNKKYKLKLVTQEVECEIISIDKVIDATTLEELIDVKEVKLNDVAQVIIKTKGIISFDKFSENNSMGRFVIIDEYDVSGGGIISTLKIGKESIGTIFIKENIEINLDIFEEYYIILPGESISKVNTKKNIFRIGESVDIEGETFHYGENFDILSVDKNMVVKIREKKLNDIVYLDKYNYEIYNIINEKGFRIKINNNEELYRYVEEYKALVSLNHKLIDFYNKWLDFSSFRNIKYLES
ncbi:sulfate adenylyltransferase subunit 1 [Clostridium nigeriense]|uniref:sulfate adenylyltransferase subunit 1 n=1 Tax=Clostridium nigeriense TaxID=1805470 RepID=UPI003D3333B6